MKNRLCAVLLAVLMLTAFAGCRAGGRMDALEDTLESRLEAVEDTIENALEQKPVPTSAPVQTATVSTKLTAGDAEAIALKDAGLTAEQVTGLRSEYDVDRGVAEFDVEFHHDGWEYDYEIHAQTGEILFKDKERDD